MRIVLLEDRADFGKLPSSRHRVGDQWSCWLEQIADRQEHQHHPAMFLAVSYHNQLPFSGSSDLSMFSTSGAWTYKAELKSLKRRAVCLYSRDTWMTGKTGVIIVMPITIVILQKGWKVCIKKLCATSSLLTMRLSPSLRWMESWLMFFLSAWKAWPFAKISWGCLWRLRRWYENSWIQPYVSMKMWGFAGSCICPNLAGA